MEDHLQLLTSIRDILTRIERVLERIEQGSALAAVAPAESSLLEPPVPPATTPAAPVVNPTNFGRAKWTKR